MKFEKGGQEWAMFGDLYRLAQKYWEVPEPNCEQDAAYWEGLVRDAGILMQQYENIPYAEKACMALLETAEEQYRKKQGICA